MKNGCVCTGTQRNETLTNCVTTLCMDMKTIGIPPCTGTPGQPLKNYDLGLENAWAERKAREHQSQRRKRGTET